MNLSKIADRKRSKFSFILFIFLSWSITVMAIEEPKYTVEKKDGNIEIRRYEPVLVAETTIDGDFESSGNRAFRILADYIFGNNKTQTKIEMTAPVSQESSSQKIEMTAPVNQVQAMNGYLVQFTMPSKFTLETLPIPNDSRVVIRQIPARRLAVFSYSGGWGEARYNEKLSELKRYLEAQNLKSKGQPVFARYNSPFALWFLRRNEIWLEVE